jgi:hypothetical protein
MGVVPLKRIFGTDLGHHEMNGPSPSHGLTVMHCASLGLKATGPCDCEPK